MLLRTTFYHCKSYLANARSSLTMAANPELASEVAAWPCASPPVSRLMPTHRAAPGPTGH